MFFKKGIPMRSLMGFLVVAVMTLFAFESTAGVRVYNGTRDLNIFDSIKCSTGLTCSKTGAKATFVLNYGVATLSPLVAATATTITAAQCGSTFYNAGAVVIKLPKGTAALAGCTLTFATMNASNFDVNPDDLDVIVALTNATGDMIRNATLGNTVMLRLVSATQWVAVGISGTWTDAN